MCTGLRAFCHFFRFVSHFLCLKMEKRLKILRARSQFYLGGFRLFRNHINILLENSLSALAMSSLSWIISVSNSTWTESCKVDTAFRINKFSIIVSSCHRSAASYPSKKTNSIRHWRRLVRFFQRYSADGDIYKTNGLISNRKNSRPYHLKTLQCYGKIQHHVAQLIIFTTQAQSLVYDNRLRSEFWLHDSQGINQKPSLGFRLN